MLLLCPAFVLLSWEVNWDDKVTEFGVTSHTSRATVEELIQRIAYIYGRPSQILSISSSSKFFVLFATPFLDRDSRLRGVLSCRPPSLTVEISFFESRGSKAETVAVLTAINYSRGLKNTSAIWWRAPLLWRTFNESLSLCFVFVLVSFFSADGWNVWMSRRD